MNKQEKFIIAINRELGSGGRTVGQKLAERLNVPFYDKALIKALEAKYNLSSEEIETLKGRSHTWWADFKRVMSIGQALNASPYYQIAIGQEPDILTTDEIYHAETEILHGIADTESCVIAGRTAFHVFRNHPNHLNILIQASKEHRIQRVVRKRGISEKEAEKIIDKVDKMRSNYVEKYTKQNRYDAHCYDLVFNMDGKTEDEIVDLIIRYIG